jgi:hypothetical protein
MYATPSDTKFPTQLTATRVAKFAMNTEYASLSARVLMLIANDRASERQATTIVPNRPAVFHLTRE